MDPDRHAIKSVCAFTASVLVFWSPQTQFSTALAQNSNFVYSATLSVSNASSILCVLAADLKNSGKLDLVCSDNSTNALSIFTNNGAGSFLLSTNLKVASQPFWLQAADLNGNGTLDLVSSGIAKNTLTVATNTGAGILKSNASYTVPGVP